MPGLSLAHPIVDIQIRTHADDPDIISLRMKNAEGEVAVTLSRRMGFALFKMLEAELQVERRLRIDQGQGQ